MCTNSVGCVFEWGDSITTFSRDIIQPALGTGNSCPAPLDCVSQVEDLTFSELKANVQIVINIKMLKKDQVSTKTLFQQVVSESTFDINKVCPLIKEKVDKVAALVDMKARYRSQKASLNQAQKDDQIKALKLMMPRKLKLNRKTYETTASTNEGKINEIKSATANQYDTVEELVDVVLITSVEASSTC